MDLATTTGYVPGFHNELNLRELGGLPTADGRHVKHGLFFRGSTLADLLPEQCELVDNMGLRYLLDLRATGEAQMSHDYVPHGCTYKRICGMHYDDGAEADFSPQGIAEIERRLASTTDQDSFLHDLYVGMAFGNEALHALVERMVADDVPLYFHCTAGKDRTGVSALIIGLVLGITRQAIMDDFLLTNEYRRSIIEGVARRMPADTPPEVIERWQKANGVQEENLTSVIDAIEARCGTVENYLSEEFGLDEGMLSLLRARYLE
ncbi:MAG: tyrosine-protein phosphatase [Atopobiaceae bacterium]|nr:tyrosine-protein phosphatase [Atopobiaceae bacterium]MDO4404065.1 tyrosine-protein phosphatase [Atopobiaceae bacterium]